jgi:hypothetical protein
VTTGQLPAPDPQAGKNPAALALSNIRTKLKSCTLTRWLAGFLEQALALRDPRGGRVQVHGGVLRLHCEGLDPPVIAKPPSRFIVHFARVQRRPLALRIGSVKDLVATWEAYEPAEGGKSGVNEASSGDRERDWRIFYVFSDLDRTIQNDLLLSGERPESAAYLNRLTSVDRTSSITVLRWCLHSSFMGQQTKVAHCRKERRK